MSEETPKRRWTSWRNTLLVLAALVLIGLTAWYLTRNGSTSRTGNLRGEISVRMLKDLGVSTVLVDNDR